MGDEMELNESPQEVSDNQDVVESPPEVVEEDNSNNSSDVRIIKVDGEEIEVSIDDLEKSYGLDRAARKRFEEASNLRKEVDSFIESMQMGDLSHLADMVPEDKLHDFAESVLRKKIEWEDTPEETRAKIMAERERDKYKEELEEYTKKEQEQIVNYVNEQAAIEIDNEIVDSIEELSKDHGSIVKTPEFIQDVARIMLAQLNNGAADLDPGKAAKLALKGWKNRLGAYVGNISQDELGNYLTKDQIKQLRKSELNTALGQFPSYEKGSSPKKASRKSKTVNVGNWFDQIEKNL